MDSGAVTATLSKKLSNGYGVSGKSAYDGVFASPIKFRAHSLSSSFEDYCEIFGGSEASLGSSIPVLELPELNERKLLHDVRRSKLDYSKVFGGFGNLDTAVPYEELFAEPKKKDSFPEGASSPDKGENQCSEEDSTNCSKEIPLVAQEASTFNGAKRINLSYHKINQGSESRKKGTTHIAQLHAVPAYTCLIEEVNPLKIDGAEKSIPVVQHTYPGSHCEEGIKKSGHCSKSFNGPSPDSASTQSSNDRAKVPDRSDSIHLFFDACDISHGRVPTSQTVSGNLDNHHGHAVRSMPTKRQVCKSDASEGATGADSASTQSSNDQAKVPDRSDSIHLFFDACDISHGRVPTSQTVSGNLDNHHGHAVRSMPTKRQVYKSDASEGAAGSDSPLHLDEMVDSNSEAAASVAALRKAIEEAQERLKVAKDLMKRKKEGCPDRIKRRFNNDLKAGGKKEDKFAYKMRSHEETNMWQTFGEMDALPQISSMIEKPMMRVEQVTPDHRAEEMFFSDEAVREAQEKLDSTIAEHIEEEVEYKEADHKDATLEFKDSDNNKKVLYIIDDCQWNEKNAGKEAFEKPEESHQTMEVVEGTCVQESNEGKVNAGNEAGIELVDEKKLSCEELVDDIKLAQETFDYGAKDKKLKVEEEEETENRVTPLLEQEYCESKLGECGLMIGNDNKFNCKPEDEKNVEGHCQQEECLRNLRDYQGFVVLKKKITQEQREGEEKVEVFSHLEECELSEILDPIDNEKTFNPHDLDLVSMERQIENLGCVEDGKEADFLDLNQEIEHCCQREGTKNRFGNFCVPEILEGIVGHVHDEEGFHEIMTKDSDSEGFQDAQEKEMEFEGATNLMEENERGRKHNSESEEMINVTQNGPNYEEKKTKEAGRTMEREHCCQREGTKNRLGNICVPEILEGIVGHVHDEEGFREIMTKDSDSEGFQDAQEKEMELEGATNLMEENERGRKHNSESEEIMSVTQNGPNCEEKKIKESGRTTEISPNNEPDEGENLSKIRAADTNVESDETPEVTPEGYVHNEEDDILVASNASFQREEKYNDSESVQEMNDLGEKHSLKTSALTQGALEHNEVANQMPYTNETVSFDSAATYIGDPDMKVEQNQDDCLKEAENNCNRAMLVEETSPEFQDIFKCVKDAEDALNAEIDESQSNFSDGEILVDNDHNIEASQPPIMSEWQSSSFNYQENKSSNSNPKEIHQATLTMEENKANDTSQKVELETEHLRKIDEAKEREREKEKEKIAVERAIREVRERAFAEARERASLERAAAEARRKNISDGRERLGKATGQANEKTPAERVAMEAKLKAERAAVERATAEARARALERALSEKAASEARNKPDKVFAEKSFGGSREIGMKPNFSKSFTYGETFDGANGDSAQRCKARSERHQRIGERVAQALAEKNARDRLVQKEQEDRNRVAETLDADVKRWSSGKEGNLRALLSTLQYILGPDSGWQPIHLTDIINATAVKKAYRKATLFVHPDKLQQRGASIQQKYTCEKVFDLLKEAWNRFNMEER